MISDFEKAILKTIIFFDVFDYPLTDWEIYKNLISEKKHSFADVKNALKEKTGKLSQKESFYFLPNRQSLVEKRKERYVFADKKYKIAKKNAKLLSRMPFVRAIFVCNSLSYSNANDSSDIDFAIIASKKKIWAARFFCAGLMKLLNRRPARNNSRNKICLSFFLDENDLCLKNCAYPGDAGFIFWLNQFAPIYDPENLFERLRKENAWSRLCLLNYITNKPNDRRKILKKSRLQKILEVIFASDIFEKFFKRLQMKIMPDGIKKLAENNPKDVIISDNVLKLHTKDNRQEVNSIFRQRCAEIIYEKN